MAQFLSIPVDENQKEIASHGSRAFPVAVYYDILSDNVLGYVNWHWHYELQLCAVEKGRVLFIVDGRSITLEEGEGIFINSKVLHSVRPVTGDGTYICINYSPVILGMFPGSIFYEKYVDPFVKSEVTHIVFSDREGEGDPGSIIDSMRKVYEMTAGDSKGKEYEIIHELQNQWLKVIDYGHERFRRLIGSNKKTGVVREILSYIEMNYSDKITIEKIASAVSFSGSECCRMFKRELGETIFTYLNNYRIEQSTHLLKYTDMSVTDIAYEAGFSHASYFIQTFKNTVGITPKKYREKYYL